jgi:hypothetical protein
MHSTDCGDENSVDKLSIGFAISEQYRKIIQVKSFRLWRASLILGLSAGSQKYGCEKLGEFDIVLMSAIADQPSLFVRGEHGIEGICLRTANRP